MKKKNKKNRRCIIILIPLFLFASSCYDTAPPDNYGGVPKFAAGPSDSEAPAFSKGMIHAAGETLGVFMDRSKTSGSIETATDLVYGNAYMGLVQEDTFRYCRDKYLEQFLADEDSAEKKYLKIASQMKAIMSCYKRYVYLLINTDKISASNLDDLLSRDSSLEINLGTVDSETYISAKTITDALDFKKTPTFFTDDAKTGISKVITGDYDAAFLVDESPSSVLAAISDDAPVELIGLTLPEGKKYYRETGTIKKNDYGFQDKDFINNIVVRMIAATGPNFSNRVLNVFIDYALSNISDYSAYNDNWLNVSETESREFIIDNPLYCSYRAACHILGYDELDIFYTDSYFCSGESTSVNSDMATELIWLLSYNMNIDLKEKNTTGSWENSYWLANSGAKMALVQEDIYRNLSSSGTSSDTIQLISMKKVAPLNYEYVHLVTYTGSWGTSWSDFSGRAPSSLSDHYLESIFTSAAEGTALHINVGPKTSGTFYSAMQIIKSYADIDSDSDGTPDLEELEIHYHFDSPSDAIPKVEAGTYHLCFVTSGLPYYRFYSHDTYSLPTTIAIIPARFYQNRTPEPYSEGTLAGGGEEIYENYPYSKTILPSDITTTRVRSNLVISAPFDDSRISKYLISIFRKTYYMINPYDPDDTDFAPDPAWISVLINSYSADDSYFSTRYGSYGEDITGAKEYFARNPFGWSDSAAEYYLSIFSGD